MTPRTLVAAVLALSLTCSGASFAQDRGNNGERGNQGHGRQAQPQHGGQAAPRAEQHSNNRPGNQGRPDQGGQRDERGAGPDHNFHRGGHLPTQYRSNQYVVDDWRGHHLSAPPRGYHWVQTGGDYVLVAIATGIIMQLLLDH